MSESGNACSDFGSWEHQHSGNGKRAAITGSFPVFPVFPLTYVNMPNNAKPALWGRIRKQLRTLRTLGTEGAPARAVARPAPIRGQP